MKYYKLYGIFKFEDDKLLGYVEHSFSMAWDPGFVRLWSKKHIQFYIDKDDILKKNDAFVMRVTRKDLPYGMVINWAERFRVTHIGPVNQLIGRQGKKFDWRNVRFTTTR